MCMRDMWVVQWYCVFEGLVETCEVVGVELYWKLIAKIMGVACEVVAGFLHRVCLYWMSVNSVNSGTEVLTEMSISSDMFYKHVFHQMKTVH